MSEMSDIHFNAGEPDRGGHNTKCFDRLDFGVEEAIAHAESIHHVGLAFGEFAVAL
jgi:hypothetical protein